MRTRLLLVAVVLLPALGWSAGFSARNPAVRNPVGVGRAPVSSYRSGLVTTPVPIDATADLAMTGNLRDGKHFRGNVPYRSTSDIGLDPGSSSINSHRGSPSLSSFLRDTAGWEDVGRRSSVEYGARPYYSSSEAVARTVPVGGGVSAPHGTGDGSGVRQQARSAPTNLFTLEPGPRQHVLAERDMTTTLSDFQRFQSQYGPLNGSLTPSDGAFIRGMSPDRQTIEPLTPSQAAAVRRQDDKLIVARLREQSRQPLPDVRQDSAIGNRGALIADESYRSEFSGPISSSAGAKDAVAGRYRPSPLKTFEPSTDSILSREPLSQDSRGLGATNPALTAGEGDDFPTHQKGSLRPAPQYALPTQGGPVTGAEQDDVLARIKQQLDELSRSVESHLQAKPDDAVAAGVVPRTKTYTTHLAAPKTASDSREPASLERATSGYTLKTYEPSAGKEVLVPARTRVSSSTFDGGLRNRFEYPTTAGLEAAQKSRSVPGGTGELSRAEVSAEAKRIMGRHRSPDSLAADKFNRHLRAGEGHLTAGKYYRAADSFALASIYRPDDPRALAGRSHALFAAGEYMSSALFLSRALASRPEHAKVRVDFTTLLGGPDRLADRLADIEQWFARSGSGQLQLLLAYVYYQTGRLSEAGRAVETVYRKMPQSPAAAAIAAAINNAAAGQ